MELDVNLAATAWTLIPIALTIICVFATRRILLSMLVGIVAAAFMSVNFNVFDTVMLIERTMTGILFSDAQTALFSVFSRWYMSIIIFLFGLGIVTSTVVLTGSAKAFVNSVSRRVKTRKGVQFVTVIVGVVLMIDDYFNAMVNGNIAKTLSAKHNLSRARSSYIVDSIAAPICIVAPVSSWAVAIMGNMSRVYESIGVERVAFTDFIRMIPFQFYVFSAIGLVLVTICLDFNMFTMKKYERSINETGQDLSAEEDTAGLLVGEQSTKGKVWEFWLPIICLAAATVGTMFITGFESVDFSEASDLSPVHRILDGMSLSMSLLMGGIAAIVSSMYVAARHVKKGEVTKQQYWKSILAGLKSMVTPVTILILSWTLSSLIGYLEVGYFVSDILYAAGISYYFIPFIMFISAALLAFAIGTSWGTFAIVLPIAGAVVSALGNLDMLLPAMAAVLSGAVFGDHSSPISDTTVLSSAGTSCKVISHFESQLPYAILAAILTAVGFLFFGLTGTLVVGYIAFAVALAVTIIIFMAIKKKRGGKAY